MSSAAIRLDSIADGGGKSVTNDIPVQIDADSIFQLQVEQREHDDRYHPEISRLPIHQRLNHLALHFAKYAGRIADAMCAQDDSDIDRTLTDILIIALSSSNVLNVHLGLAISEEPPRRARTGLSLDWRRQLNFDLMELLIGVASASGKMAKACEKLDHLEPVPFHEQISQAVIELARIAIEHSFQRELNVFDAVRQRLEEVRNTKIFHKHAIERSSK